MAIDKTAALAKLEQANQDRLKKEYSGKAGTKFVTEVKESMLFQYNWAELLSAAPTALSLLGACHVASSSNEAAAITLGSAQPKGGWQYLKVAGNPTLKACLVFIGDQGAKAFMIAGNNMDKISSTSGDLNSTVTEAVQAIQKLPDSNYARILNNKLTQLRRLSDSCLKYADDTEKAFDSWLLCVAEFHTASVQKHGTTEADAEKNTSFKLQAEIEAQYKNKEVDSANEAAKAMLASLNKAEAAFEKANSDVPSAWETCAMGAINAIAQAGPTIIAQALPAVLAMANPMSAVTGIAGAFGKAAQQGAANAPGVPPLVGAVAGAVMGSQAANSAAGPSLAPTDLAPPTDPAYGAAPLISPFVSSLYSYLTQGPNESIDWTKFKDIQKEGEIGQAKGITWLLINIQQQEKSAHLGTGEPSTELKTAFARTIKVIEGIKSEILKSSELSSGGTSADIVKGWQSEIKEAKATLVKLETTAKSFPGTSADTPQMRSLKIDVKKTDYTAQNAALSAATEKLAINQRALDTAQENYQKASDSALKIQQDLTAIQTKLQGLEVEGQTLEKVKEILIDCIAILVELKKQIGKLKAFFLALSTMVRTVVQNKVQKFDEDVSSLAEETSKKGILRLNDMDIEIIYSSTLQIKAYFDLLHTICRMYTRMHVDHVEPGLNLVFELSKGARDPSQMREKRVALDSFTEKAQKDIMKTVEAKQQEIKDGLQSRIDGISEQTQMLEQIGLPRVDATFAAAMKTGSATISEHVGKMLPDGLQVNVNEDISC